MIRITFSDNQYVLHYFPGVSEQRGCPPGTYGRSTLGVSEAVCLGCDAGNTYWRETFKIGFPLTPSLKLS